MPKLESELRSLQQIATINGLAFDNEQFDLMLSYIRLLLKWNRSFNLISRSDEENIVGRHIAESIGLLPVANPPLSCSMMDIGSGGGFPALPIKILRPDLRLTLVESNGKKAIFLKNVGAELSLKDYSVLDTRIEGITKEQLPEQSLITARAVADLPVLWKWIAKHLASGGKLLAIKPDAFEEIETVSKAPEISEILKAPFPAWLNIDNTRIVISIKKK